MRGAFHWVSLAGLLLPACTLAFDADDFPGIKEAPVISIEIVDPATGDVVGVVPPDDSDGLEDQVARTVHDLRLRIDGALNGRGEPIDQFRVEWEKAIDSDGSTLITETVAATQIASELTAKGQTWVVTVTPIAGDREGPAAALSVEVQNSAPIIGGLGLSSYTPMRGDSIQAYATKLFDEDGDPVLVRYQWYLGDQKGDDTRVDEEDGNRLLLPMGDDSPTNLYVDAEASDIEGLVTTRSLGALAVLPRQTLWRPLRPDTLRELTGRPFALASDAANRRAILLKGSRLWEYRLDEPHRWVALAPSGDEPPAGAYMNWVIDPDGERMIVFGGVARFNFGLPSTPWREVHVLSTEQGNERWTRLLRPEDDPELPTFTSSTAVFDSERSRVLVFGARGGGPSELERVWAMTIDGDRFEWEELTTENAPARREGAMVVFDPNGGQAFMIGGFEVGEGADAARQVWRVTFPDSGTVRFESAFSSNQPALGFAATTVAPSGDKILFIGGQRDLATPSTAAYEMSLEGELAWNEVVLGGDAIPPIRRGLAAALGRDGYVVMSNNDMSLFTDGSADVYIGWLQDDRHELLESPELTYPPPGQGPSSLALRQGGSAVALVQLPWDATLDHLWSFSTLTEQWERFSIEPDPQQGMLERDPGAAIGYGWGGETVGITALGVDAFLWELDGTLSSGFRWQRIGTPSPLASPNYSVAGSRGGLVLGGSGAMTERVVAGGATWNTVADAVPLTNAGAVQVGYQLGVNTAAWHAVIFGGEDGGALTQDLHIVERPHTNSPQWRTTPPEDAAEAPQGRIGHTMAVQAGRCSRDGVVGPWQVFRPAEIYVFGGASGTALNDTWRLTHAGVDCDETDWRWEAIDRGDGEGVEMPLGRPLPRTDHQSVWDGPRQRLIVTGGIRTPQSLFSLALPGNEVWALTVVEEDE